MWSNSELRGGNDAAAMEKQRRGNDAAGGHCRTGDRASARRGYNRNVEVKRPGDNERRGIDGRTAGGAIVERQRDNGKAAGGAAMRRMRAMSVPSSIFVGR